jgi:hypothetical protein
VHIAATRRGSLAKGGVVAAIATLLVAAVAVQSGGTQTPPTAQVTNCTDSGPGSLPGVIAAAPDGATITFATPCPQSQPITLTNGTLAIDEDLSIVGPRFGQVVVNGANLSTVFQIDTGDTVELSGLTIEDGASPGNPDGAGGIDNYGMLTISGCTVTNNVATYGGGGVNNFGTLTVTRSTVTNNSAAFGGGIANEGTAVVESSSISANSATNGGGGIASSDAPTGLATLTVSDSTVVNNTAAWGAGITNEGAALVKNTIVGGNTSLGVGGGLFDETNSNGTIPATLTVKDSVLVNNTSAGGGGIFNYGATASVARSFLAGNTGASTAPYPGILNDGGGTLTVDQASWFFAGGWQLPL